MTEPNYILKMNDAALVPKKNAAAMGRLKIAVWIVAGIIFISFLFGENVWVDMSWMAKCLFLSLVISTLFVNTHERAPAPLELWFYDDCLILYKEKRQYSRKLVRMEYDKFYYKDIKQCQFRKHTQRINIYGVVEGIWYNYAQDGTVSKEPSYHKTTDSIRYFYTTYAGNIDIVKEIESHSPIKVDVNAT